jgi:hydrogenase assembly chaperone HypC/HupF
VGRVNFGGVVKRVCLDYVPEVEVGDYTIVHVGFALSKIDEETAEQTLADFREMGMLEEELAEGGRGVCAGCGRRSLPVPTGAASKMKYLTEFRNGEIAQRMAREIARHRDAAVEDHGGLRRADALHHQERDRPDAAGRDRDDSRARLPGVRDPAGIDRQGAGDCRAAGGDFLLVWRHAAGSGDGCDLFQVKGAGGDVRVVYSPLDAVEIGAKNPDKQVVFFGVGFETTAPANAMSVHVAKRRGLKNFSLLVSHVLVPPAIAAILESPGNKVQAFLLAGHVCSVMGYWEYPPLAESMGSAGGDGL